MGVPNFKGDFLESNRPGRTPEADMLTWMRGKQSAQARG